MENPRTPLHRFLSRSADLLKDQPQISQSEWCVHDLIAIQAETTPDAVALTMGRKKLTYGQLNASANRLAHFLRAREIGPEVLVGLSLKRSVEMVVSILGILKAGRAYVPLDPNDPAERLLFELQDSGAKILVTTGDLATTLPVNDLTVICVDADWPEIALESDANPAPGARLANPAYAIYTS